MIVKKDKSIVYGLGGISREKICIVVLIVEKILIGL